MTYLVRPSRPYFYGQKIITMKTQRSINSMHYEKPLNIKSHSHFLSGATPYFTQIEEFSQFQDLINYMKNGVAENTTATKNAHFALRATPYFT